MHRDFKLANILKHEGNIKIADFGFAKLLGSDNLTSTMLGSPLNMAPEGIFIYHTVSIYI
jgi:serine/threonine-protein kinase ULK/ATG1